MSEQDVMNEKIVLEGETITLADLAGISLDGVQEKRGESFPKGTFVWEIEGGENTPKLGVFGEGDKKKAGVQFVMKCLEVVAVSDPEFTGNQQDLIGKSHRELLFLGAPIQDSLGYLKAFLKDTGVPYDPNLNTQLANAPGCRFQGTIAKRHNKDDKDIVYTNINRNAGKIRPLAAAAQSSVGAALA